MSGIVKVTFGPARRIRLARKGVNRLNRELVNCGLKPVDVNTEAMYNQEIEEVKRVLSMMTPDDILSSVGKILTFTRR